MQLDLKSLEARLTRDFGDNIVYQPLRVDGDALRARPVAQLMRSEQILQGVVSDEPRSLTRRAHSGLHLQGLLHHQAPPKIKKGQGDGS